MGVTRFATRTATKTGVKASRLTLRIAMATAVSALWGWWYDRPGLVRDRALESPFEHRAQVASAIFWPAFALWLAGGAAGCPAFVASLAEPLAVLPFVAWIVATALFATVVLMRRMMATAGRGWPLGALVRATRRWLSHYPALTGGLIVGCAVVPALNAAGEISSTVTRAIPVATVLGVGALIALREAAWRKRIDSMTPRIMAVHKVTENVAASALFMPSKGKGFVMVHIPEPVKANLDGLDERVALHWPEFEAVVRRSTVGAVTSIDYRPTGAETAQMRDVLARSGGLIAALTPTGSSDPARPDEHVARLADGVTGTKAELLDERMRREYGLSLVEWAEGAREAYLARLDDITLAERDRIADHRKCRPWDLGLVVTADEAGTVNDVRLTRFPPTTEGSKRRHEWLTLANTLWPSPDRRRWQVEDHPGEDWLELLLTEDRLTRGFSISEFIEEYRDPCLAPEESWMSFPVALREDGTVVEYNLFHTLVCGQTGAGKGSILWSVVSGLLPAMRAGLVEIYAIDPKNAEAPSAPNLFKEIAVEPDQWGPMLERLVEDLKVRQAQPGRTFKISRNKPLRLIFIDEMSALSALDADKERSRAVMQNLLILLSQGRSDGNIVLSAVQAPQKEMVGQARMFYALRVALRTETATETDIILGAGSVEDGATAHLIPPANPGNGYATAGVGFMRVDGESRPVRVRFPYTSDEQLAAWNDEFASRQEVKDLGDLELTADDLAAFDDFDDFEPVETPAPAKPSKWDDVEW